jgi:hypothetical protein
MSVWYGIYSFFRNLRFLYRAMSFLLLMLAHSGLKASNRSLYIAKGQILYQFSAANERPGIYVTTFIVNYLDTLTSFDLLKKYEDYALQLYGALFLTMLDIVPLF